MIVRDGVVTAAAPVALADLNVELPGDGLGLIST